MKQTSFASAEFAGKKRRTRRERFLADMEAVVPWTRLEALIEPHYPKRGTVGGPPAGLSTMLRMYFLQQWYTLADEALEDALYDSQAMREFVGIDLSRQDVPDATTLLKFRHLLEEHELGAAILAEVNAHLTERGLLMRQGTVVDATIIAAPSSTKNSKICERIKARVRARVEHPYHVIKNLFGYRKVSYRGLAKNAARAKVRAALANLYSARRRFGAVGVGASAA